ncbi:MAG TPA: DNA polymerase III subunit delta [Gemmatimonadales bacterium]
MAALTFDALVRGLKHGALDPVYYLHGEEDVLKEEAVRALVDRALDPAARDFNLDSRAAADLDPDALRTLVDTPPMMAERRVVILRGVEQWRKTAKARDELRRYLEHPSPTTLLILMQSGDDKPDADLARATTLVTIDRLSAERVERWIAHRARQIGLTIEPEAASLLAEAAGADLALLSQELEKLRAIAGTRAATAADVSAAVGVRRGETVVDLVARTLERRPADAVRLLEPVLAQSGVTGVRIVSAIGTALLGVAVARAELDRGAAPARAERAVFQHLMSARLGGLGAGYQVIAARWTSWAPRWKAPELADALRRALAADRALKGSTISDERGIVMELILGCGVTAREAA